MRSRGGITKTVFRNCALGFFFLGLFGLNVACTSSPNNATVTIPPAPAADDEYQETLTKWQRSVKVYDQFQNRIELNAVLFTEEMRSAYVARWKRLRGDSNVSMAAEFGGNLAVLVSLFTPQEDFMRLDNKNLWTLRMGFGSETLVPVTVLRLYDKPMHEGFFDFISKWSSEYLVVFDVSTAGASQSVALPEFISAQFYSSLAYIDLRWP
jgi:hypothetical protein